MTSKRLENSVKVYGIQAIETTELKNGLLGVFIKPSKERWIEDKEGNIVTDNIPLTQFYVGGVEKMETEMLPDWEAVI
jgi:hypothetical protein